MTRLVWTLPDGQHTARWAEDEGGGGGGGLSSLSDSGTVTKDTPHVHVFDLSVASFFFISTEAMTLTGDGETFGAADGDLGIETFFEISSDDASWVSLSGSVIAKSGDPSNGLAIAVGDGTSGLGVTRRYLRVTLTMYTQPDEDPYVGANNPTAEMTTTVSYSA